MGDALAALCAALPGVHVTAEMLGTDDAIAQVLADAVDLAFVVLPLADSRLDIHPLGEEEILLATPRAHPWAEREVISLSDALAEPDLLLSMPGHGLRGQLEQEAQALGVRLESRLDLRSQRALLELVARGVGTAFAPRSSVRVMGDALAAIPLSPRLTRRLGWIARRGRRVPAAGQILAERVRDELLAVDRG
jgi:LysR family hydrogen peroxide-inducible transcriptional activator